MILRQLAASALIVALSVGAEAQQTQAPPHDEDDPRYRIQIDVSASVPDNELWIELQSKNFAVAGTASEDDIRKVAADLELLRDTFAQFNPRLKGVSPTPTTVLVFRNSGSFRWYRPEDDRQPEKATAYLQKSPDKTYIVMKYSGAIPREIYRAYLLQLIPQAMAPVPLWFREGIADYFSSMKVDRDHFGGKRWIRVGTAIDEYDRALDKKATLLPFETLFQIHEGSVEYTNPEGRKLFLAESWGIVHYLMARPGGSAAMQRLFNLLGDGETFEAAVTKALGQDLKSFETDFSRYIQLSHDKHQWSGNVQLLSKSTSQIAKGECGKVVMAGVVPAYFPQCYSAVRAFDRADPPGVFRIPYSFDKTWVEVAPLNAHGISEAEAWYYRGDLMLHIGRLGEADAYLQRAVRQPLQLSRTYASLGLLQLYQEHYADSEKSLQHALELDPQNYLAHYYRAIQIRLKGLHEDSVLAFEDLEEIHNELLKSIELAPHFVEAAEMLSVVNLMRQTSSRESEKVLVEALKRYPGRSTLWVSLANVSARLGDGPGSRWLLTRLLSAGAPEAETRKSAVTLLEGIAPGASRAIISLPITGGALAGSMQMPAATPPASRSTNKVSGEKLKGVLTNIECRNGLTLIVKAGGKTVKLHSNSPLNVEFVSLNREGRAIASDPVVCGPTIEQGLDVTITYRPSRSGDSIGEPLSVDVLVEN
jgi:tetratricopeptide (TPR) repeat protein